VSSCFKKYENIKNVIVQFFYYMYVLLQKLLGSCYKVDFRIQWPNKKYFSAILIVKKQKEEKFSELPIRFYNIHDRKYSLENICIHLNTQMWS